MTSKKLEFKCVKKGKKNIWQKLPKKEATPNEDRPQPEPTQNSASSQPIAKVESIVQRWAKTESQALPTSAFWRENLASGIPKTSITYWFGKNVPESVKEASKQRFENAILQWERYVTIKRSKVFFNLGMFSDKNEICEDLEPRSGSFQKEWCLRQINESQQRILYHAAAYESEGGWRPVLSPTLSPRASMSHIYALEDEAIFNSSSFYPRIEHEWFHQIQYDLTGNETVRQFGCWFIEGAAEYFGLLAATSQEPEIFLRYRTAWTDDFRDDVPQDLFEEWMEGTSIPRLPQPNGDPCQKYEQTPYRTGALLTEWMVGKVGLDGFLDILRKTGEIGWLRAFEAVVGKSLKDSYLEMGSYVRKEYEIVRENPWIRLPNCPSYKDHNKAVCLSNNILRPNR